MTGRAARSGSVPRYGGDGCGGREPANLGDILERVLDKGIVIAGDIQVNLLDIELLTIKLRLLIASVDTARELGIDWWEHDPWLPRRPARSGRGEPPAAAPASPTWRRSGADEHADGERRRAPGLEEDRSERRSRRGPGEEWRGRRDAACRRSDAVTESGTYLYAIARDPGARPPSGLTGLLGAPVRAITEAGLVAYVSTVPLASSARSRCGATWRTWTGWRRPPAPTTASWRRSRRGPDGSRSGS